MQKGKSAVDHAETQNMETCCDYYNNQIYQYFFHAKHSINNTQVVPKTFDQDLVITNQPAWFPLKR